MRRTLLSRLTGNLKLIARYTDTRTDDIQTTSTTSVATARIYAPSARDVVRAIVTDLG